MLVFTLVVKFLRHESIPLLDLFGEVFFLQNYVGKLWIHTWSLAVEEHFYLGLALLFGYLVRKHKTRSFSSLPPLFALIAIVCLGLRISNLYFHPHFSPDTYVFETHLRLDSLFFGVLLAYLETSIGLSKRLAGVPTALLLLAGGACLSPAFLLAAESHRTLSIVGFDLFALGSGLILFAALRLVEPTNALLRLLASLGAASYSIYLWHLPLLEWGVPVLQRFTGKSYPVYLVLSLCGACLVGWGMNRLLEAPVLRLRDRLFPASPSKPA